MRSLCVALLSICLLPTAHAADQAARELLIPIVGRSPGAFGSIWQCDVILTNTTPTYNAIDVQLELNDGQTTTATVSVPMRNSIVLEDVVRTLFGRESALGSLRVRASVSDARIVARAWIYNVNAENTGRFGQNVPGVPVDQLTKSTVLNLGDPADGTRTNIGISNPSDETAHVNVNTVSGINVPPRSVVQINDVSEATPIFIDSDRPVYTYASVIDAGGDPTFVAGTATEIASPITPACAQPLPLGRPADHSIAPGYLVMLQSVQLIDPTLAKHGITPLSVWRALGGFYAELAPETVAALRCDPAVTIIEHNAYAYLSSKTTIADERN